MVPKLCLLLLLLCWINTVGAEKKCAETGELVQEPVQPKLEEILNNGRDKVAEEKEKSRADQLEEHRRITEMRKEQVRRVTDEVDRSNEQKEEEMRREEEERQKQILRELVVDEPVEAEMEGKEEGDFEFTSTALIKNPHMGTSGVFGKAVLEMELVIEKLTDVQMKDKMLSALKKVIRAHMQTIKAQNGVDKMTSLKQMCEEQSRRMAMEGNEELDLDERTQEPLEERVEKPDVEEETDNDVEILGQIPPGLKQNVNGADEHNEKDEKLTDSGHEEHEVQTSKVTRNFEEKTTDMPNDNEELEKQDKLTKEDQDGSDSQLPFCDEAKEEEVCVPREDHALITQDLADADGQREKDEKLTKEDQEKNERVLPGNLFEIEITDLGEPGKNNEGTATGTDNSAIDVHLLEDEAQKK